MKFLLINSNDKDAFVALTNDENVFIAQASEFIDETNPSNKKPDKLIHCLHKISGEHNIKDIDAIAATIGPGSFTGIRVGLSIAKGVAFALDKNIIPINSFDLTLNRKPAISRDKKYCVLIPAKQPEYYYSVIRDGIHIEYGCLELENLDKIIQKGAIIVADFDDETSIKHPYFEVINVKNLQSELHSIIKLTKAQFKNAVNAEDAEPLYLKDFVVKKPF